MRDELIRLLAARYPACSPEAVTLVVTRLAALVKAVEPDRLAGVCEMVLLFLTAVGDVPDDTGLIAVAERANELVELAEDLREADSLDHRSETVATVVHRFARAIQPDFLRRTDELMPELRRSAQVALMLLAPAARPDEVSDRVIRLGMSIPHVVDYQIEPFVARSGNRYDVRAVEVAFVKAAAELIDYFPYHDALDLAVFCVLSSFSDPVAPADVTAGVVAREVHKVLQAFTELTQRIVASDGRLWAAGVRFFDVYPAILNGLRRWERPENDFLGHNRGVAYYVDSLIRHHLSGHAE